MSGPNKEYEQAVDYLVQQFNDGHIDEKEFNQEMRDLAAEFRANAQDAADQAYDGYMRG